MSSRDPQADLPSQLLTGIILITARSFAYTESSIEAVMCVLLIVANQLSFPQ